MNTVYLDLARSLLVVSPVNVAVCRLPVLTAGDTVPFTIGFLQRNPQPLNTGNPIYNYVDMSGAGVVLNLGSAGSAPTAGGFTLTWGAIATPALPFNCSSYDVAAALNALSSIASAGGVAVQGQIGGPFTVRFLAPAMRSAFTADATNLYPASIAAVATNTAGTSTTTAQQTISFGQAPAVSLSSRTPQSAAAIPVTSLQAEVIQQVAIPAGTYGGAFTLTINSLTTPAIPFNAQFDLVQSVLNTLLGVTNVSVVAGQNYWIITIPGNTFAFTGNAAGLQIPLTLTGSFVLTSPAALALLGGGGAAEIPFTISATSPNQRTLYADTLTSAAPGL